MPTIIGISYTLGDIAKMDDGRVFPVKKAYGLIGKNVNESDPSIDWANEIKDPEILKRLNEYASR